MLACHNSAAECAYQAYSLFMILFCILVTTGGAHGGAVAWGTALQAVRSRVWFPMVSFELFIDILLLAALWPWGWLSLQQKWVPGIFPGGYRRPVRRADNPTTFMCQLSWTLGSSATWSPQGLFRPVMGLLYLYLYLLVTPGILCCPQMRSLHLWPASLYPAIALRKCSPSVTFQTSDQRKLAVNIISLVMFEAQTAVPAEAEILLACYTVLLGE